MPPRDVLLTVGSEILEATMSYRCRWFEYLNYRPLLQKYWEEDPNFRHEAAPKPRLTDADYHPDYLSERIGVEKRLEWTAQKFFPGWSPRDRGGAAWGSKESRDGRGAPRYRQQRSR